MHQTINTETKPTPFAERLAATGKTEPYRLLIQRQGISATTIARWERGDSEPAPWLQVEICRALNCRRDRLWPERPTDHEQPPVYDISRRNPHSPLTVRIAER